MKFGNFLICLIGVNVPHGGQRHVKHAVQTQEHSSASARPISHDMLQQGRRPGSSYGELLVGLLGGCWLARWNSCPRRFHDLVLFPFGAIILWLITRSSSLTSVSGAIAHIFEFGRKDIRPPAVKINI